MFPLRDDNPRHRAPVVSRALVAVNALVFLYALNLGRSEQVAFIQAYGFIPRAFFANPVGVAYSLVSSMFMHGSISHIAGNMWFLWVFGDNIEDRLGRAPFLAFYLLGGVIATLAHFLFVPTSQIPLVGASGAISAVLGAYVVLFPRQRVLTFIFPFFLFWLPAWLYLGYWGVIQLLEATSGLVVGMQGTGAGVAWWAHVGGFAFGALTVRWLATPRRVG